MGLIIPVFITHRGCPHQCLFCNQHAISGQKDGEQKSDRVGDVIETWLGRSPDEENVQVAFYGGSFTCLCMDEQRRLLDAVAPYLVDGRVSGIRLSTRPDCISHENSSFLREMGVTTVELGVQSLDDRVLTACRRGHSAEDSRRAMTILRAAGLKVGVQLLPGLPGESTRSFVSGVREIITFHPDLVRLYPAVVVKQSPLADLYQQGKYTPLSLNRAIGLTRRAKELLDEASIPVIRMGLQPSDALASQIAAGPFHPAFGELVASRQWFRRLRQRLRACRPDEHLVIHISDRDHSAVVGLKKMNIIRLEKLGFQGRFTIIPEQNRERGTVKYAVC